MKILITGAKGQLGTELLRQLENGKSALGSLPSALNQATVVGVDLEDVDLAELHPVQTLLKNEAPDVVINCAAFTNVDGCESDPDAAFAGNALAARNVAVACEKQGAKLIHVSTDYVFDGQGDTPFRESDIPSPQSVYGSTKLLGEQYVQSFCSKWFVVRTAWLYGREGNNFVKTMVCLAKERGALKVVDDQRGNPTNAEDLAHHLLQLTTSDEYGIYHCSGSGICSWYDFAAEIVRLSGIEATVEPVTSDEFPSPTKRPAFSALEHTMLRSTIGDNMRPWQEALADYMQQIKE